MHLLPRFLLFIWGLTLLWQAGLYAQSPGSNIIYCLQLGVFKNPKSVDVSKLKKIPAVIHSEDAGEGRTRLLLGRFEQRTEAEAILPEVKSGGFENAFVVERNVAAAPTNQPQLPNKIYIVQIGAFAKDIPSTETPKLAKVVNNIYSEKSGNLLKMYIGPYLNGDEALEGVSSAKKIGFGQAFRKEIESDELNKMQLYQKGNIAPVNAPANEDKPAIIAYNPVRFGDKTSFIEDIGMFSNGTNNDSIALNGRIMPVGPHELLFVGVLDPYNTDAYQPVLIYTDDNGKTWSEVLQAEYGYNIEYVEFVSPQIAYLAVMWVIEGPGELHLYRTDNGGKTWRKVAQIPRNDVNCAPTYFHFTDAKKAVLVYTGADNIYWKWTTDNGGLKWNGKGKITAAELKKLKNNGLLNHDLKGYYAAADGKTYYRQVTEKNVNLIYRRNEKNKKWEEISRLGRWYKLKDKQIIVY